MSMGLSLDDYRTLVRTKTCPYCNAKRGKNCTKGIANDNMMAQVEVDYVHDDRSLLYNNGRMRSIKHVGEPLLTPAEVASMFSVDPKTVTRWANVGKIASIRTLGGHRRFKEIEIRTLLEKSTTEGDLSNARSTRIRVRPSN